MSNSKPSQWPSHLLQYIHSSQYHSSVPAAVRLEIESGPSKSRNYVPRHRCPVVIRSISCPSHPAQGQSGLFAVKKIPPNTHILDYIGEIHCDDRPNSDYDLSLYRRQDGINVGLDASTMGNEARFINDYREIRAKPNALFCDRRTATGELRMGIWSSAEGVKKGEEILVSYGKAWWRARISTDPVGNATSIGL